MDVRLKPSGCLNQIGTVLSLGLLPLVQRNVQRQVPARLTDDSMTLRNGTRIPWTAFTRAKATEVYVQGMYMNSVFELWHPGGRLHFSTRQIQDADAVVQFILRHLPPQVLERGPGTGGRSQLG